ncbi:Gfo/Idh/MocA family oxidoreductase [Flavobacterium sp.]|uniref:Gfo/Idh/MocA family protein n=1 Tax=Flavobacterium sp. TaxID=239 RepID=UPI00286CD001|nr:Gfo/Idh/MocA family oxidoreductase [Flavobacterium sp.]
MTAKKNYTNDIRWGIIGCGNVTEVKSGPAYKQVNGFQLAAVMRRDVDKLKDYAHRHSIAKYYSSAEELITNPDIDAVYIATPPDSHKYYALKVAAAGKPCCIEKPLASCYQDSLAIYEAFKNKDIPLFVGYYRRSLPRFQQVKTWLDNNAIGELRHISWKFSKAPNANDLSGTYNWRTDATVAPGGYFDDLASHGLDLFTYLLGDVKEVYGISGNQQQLYLAKDAVTACWIHERNITGTGFWNFGCERTEDTVELFGSKGKITFSVFEENPLLLESNGLLEEVYIDNPTTVQLPHVQNMKRQLFENEFNHPSNGATATHTSWVMDKILGVL